MSSKLTRVVEMLKTSVEHGDITLGSWINVIRDLQRYGVYQDNPNSAQVLSDALQAIAHAQTQELSEQEIISNSIDFIGHYPGIDSLLGVIVLENISVICNH